MTYDEILLKAKAQLGDRARSHLHANGFEYCDGYVHFWVYGHPIAWGVDTDPVLLQHTETDQEFTGWLDLLTAIAETTEIPF